MILAWITIFTAVACVRTPGQNGGSAMIPMAKAANRWACCVKGSFGDIEQLTNVAEYTERSVKTGGEQICFGREAENKTVEPDFHCAILFDGFQYETINSKYKANQAVIKAGCGCVKYLQHRRKTLLNTLVLSSRTSQKPHILK